jgi:hypothetical protein
MGSTLQVVLDQIDVWYGWFRWRIDGLTDDEYYWEPAPHCWSVRPNGDGTFRQDPYPDQPWRPRGSDPPFTTIGWRIVHIGQPSGRIARYFGDASHPFDPGKDCPGNAADAIKWVEDNWKVWRDHIGTLDEATMWRKLGDDESNHVGMRLGRDDPMINAIQHVNREQIHHGAEIALLRDLFRWREGRP